MMMVQAILSFLLSLLTHVNTIFHHWDPLGALANGLRSAQKYLPWSRKNASCKFCWWQNLDSPELPQTKIGKLMESWWWLMRCTKNTSKPTGGRKSSWGSLWVLKSGSNRPALKLSSSRSSFWGRWGTFRYQKNRYWMILILQTSSSPHKEARKEIGCLKISEDCLNFN